MRKNRWKKILIWTASIIVVLGIGGLFAANYAVDKLISTLAADLENDLLTEDVPNEPVAPEKSGDDQTDVNNNETVKDLEGASSPKGDTTNKTDKSGQENTSTDDSKNKSGDGKKTDGYSAEVSVDKAKDLQEKITVGEKAQLTGVLLKELTMEDIKELQALSKGGMSVEEKKKARSIILERLSPEQYDELIQVAKKYGMSQGKSYAEVSKEK
ncbi:hypothetical protein FHS15_003323 [Paenibacillus castaneae]|uniref:hypothetical protein n=1 Tax=Paenibacillus castaneae TaxID=474957 RepID=UPI000C9A2794|nr:hypothetical protein [Paenibacillus castaneae]NIK78185.1 hypothetical protein [Paenibacillus castaneae]